MKSGTWHACHDEEKLKIIELQRKRAEGGILGYQTLLKDTKQKRPFPIIHIYTESRNHTSQEANDACSIQLLEIKEQLIKKQLIDFGRAVSEADDSLEEIKKVPLEFYKIVSNFKNGEYQHSYEAIVDIHNLLDNYYASIGDKKYGKTEKEIMESIFQVLCQAVDEYIDRNNDLFLRPTCITTYNHPSEPIIFVGPLRSQTTCQLPVFQLSGIARYTIVQDLINSYKHYLRTLLEYEDCKIKKLEFLIYDNQAYTPNTILYEIIETKRLRRFYFSFSGDVVVIKKDGRDINDLVQFIEGEQQNSGIKKKKVKKKNKVKRKNSKLEAPCNDVSRSSVSMDKESSVRDTTPELDLDEIEVNHKVLRTDVITEEMRHKVFSEIEEEKIMLNIQKIRDQASSSPDVSISVEEDRKNELLLDNDSDVPEITVDDIDDIDDDYTLNSITNIQMKKTEQINIETEKFKPPEETENNLTDEEMRPENIGGIPKGSKRDISEPVLIVAKKDENQVLNNDDQMMEKMIIDLKEHEKECTKSLENQIPKQSEICKVEETPSKEAKDLEIIKTDKCFDNKFEKTNNSDENKELEKDEEIDNLKRLIADQEELLQKHKDYIENLIEEKGNEMKKIIVSISDAENEETIALKRINENKSKIEELKQENEELQDICQSHVKVIEKFEKKKHKLEKFIDSEMDRFREEKNKIDEDIEQLRLKRDEAIERKIQPPPKIFSDISKIDKLMSFLEKSISAKERELECPLCLEVSSPPIFMCPESHLICSRCRPKLEKCPECRVKYKGAPKIHRYAEKAAEELLELKKEKKELFGNS